MSGSDDCARARARVMDFLKHELPPEEAADIRRHLDKCPPCEDSAEYERNFVRLLAERLGKGACPERLRARVMAALRAEPGPGAADV